MFSTIAQIIEVINASFFSLSYPKDTPLSLSANTIHINHKEQQRFNLVDQQQLVYDLKQKQGRFGILSNVENVGSLHVNFCKNEAAGLRCSRLMSGFQKIPSFGNGETHPFESGTPPSWLLEMDHSLWKDFDVVVVDSDQQTSHAFLRIGMYGSAHIVSLFDMAMGAPLDVDARLLGTNYHFPSISSPLLAFKLVMHNTSMAHLVRQEFAGESKFHIIKNTADIHFHRGPVPTTDGLLLTVWPNNDGMILQLRLDWYGSLGKCVLRLGPAIPMCLFTVSLSFLAHQLSAVPAAATFPLTEWMMQEKYSLVGLYGVVIVADQVWPDRFGLMGGSFLWWLPLFMLSAGLFLILSVGVSFFIGVLQWLPPIPANVPTWVFLFSCLGFLPVSVVAVLAYVNWLLLCASSYRSAKASVIGGFVLTMED